MVKDCVEGQPPLLAFTVIVAVIGLAVLLTAVNEEIVLPVPLAGSPMAVLLLVQLNVVPVVVLLDVKGPALCPAHTVALAGTFKSGAGSIPKVCVAVVVPHSFVTASVIEFVPGALKVIGPGSALVELAGVPPVNVHK